MKIVVATDGEGGLDAIVATDFGRAGTFTSVEVDGDMIGTVETVVNEACRVAQGAGMAAAEQIMREDADVVIAGHFGPHAEEIFEEEGIILVLMPKVTVREAVGRYLKVA
ncbi:NifB/NifX family molybdenum-iron cluster-binding protein [uncultured Methanofollis sp.]|uniref:NifB/NifX family molybdenum-iron cluster-binding protein n=1 Tax=uncultured Methanofollis sp. TaxID=262500 RepID=UPI0026243F77|nr:NifB/NifX family molybdenum-iron cluster-binding protein [uncultured Methanofollis sp.]